MATMLPAAPRLRSSRRLLGVEVAPALEGAARRGAHGDERVLQDQQQQGVPSSLVPSAMSRSGWRTCTRPLMTQ